MTHPPSSSAQAPERAAAVAPVHEHVQDHVQDHVHVHEHTHGRGQAAPRPFSVLRLSALDRLLGVSLAVAALWAGVYWAMR
jgi:hypothetical protein